MDVVLSMTGVLMRCGSGGGETGRADPAPADACLELAA